MPNRKLLNSVTVNNCIKEWGKDEEKRSQCPQENDKDELGRWAKR